MKTLKYLVLLLVVAVALPAAAQVKLEKAIEGKAEVKPGTALATVAPTTGRLSVHNAYEVSVNPLGALEAKVITEKGVIYKLEKFPNGSKKQTCIASSPASCIGGFEYVKEPTDTPLLVAEEAWEIAEPCQK